MIALIIINNIYSIMYNYISIENIRLSNVFQASIRIYYILGLNKAQIN